MIPLKEEHGEFFKKLEECLNYAEENRRKQFQISTEKAFRFCLIAHSIQNAINELKRD